MKKVTVFLTVVVLALLAAPAYALDLPNFTARVHVQDIGWSNVGSDENHHMILGTVGAAKRIEAFEISTDYPDLGIAYDTYVQDIGWQGDKNGPQAAGTEGQAKQIEAMRFYLTGANSDKFDLWYRPHVENYGWLDWAPNGAQCGTTNHFYRCEAVELLMVYKGSDPPGPTKTPIIAAATREESRHIYRVNQFRRSRGLDYVSGNATLKAVGDYRLMELPVRLSHVRPDGSDYETAVKSRFPNYPGAGGGFIESFIYGSTRFIDPDASFDCYAAYPHLLDIMLDPSIRYMSWSARISGTMGYSIELFSGLDTIDFDQY